MDYSLVLVEGGQIGPCRGKKNEMAVGRGLAAVARDRGVVVECEDFMLRLPVRDTGVDGLSPVRIGMALFCAMNGEGVWWGMPGEMAVVSDVWQRRVGLWVKGKVHQNDAIKHAVMGIRKGLGSVVMGVDPGVTTGWAIVRQTANGQVEG